MASIITVRRWLGPRLEQESTMSTDTAIKLITSRTGLTAGEVVQVLYELHDVIIDAAWGGQAVRLEKLGTFTPTLVRDGTLRLNFRPVPELKKKLTWKHRIRARILNKRSAGATDEELVEQWNELHPDDPVSLA